MRKDRILITKKSVPYTFRIALGSEYFLLTINYNETHDFFTVTLEKDGEKICEGEPIIYGFPLFHDIYVANRYPCLDIIPLDESGEQNTVTFENLNETVFLTIDNMGGDEID